MDTRIKKTEPHVCIISIRYSKSFEHVTQIKAFGLAFYNNWIASMAQEFLSNAYEKFLGKKAKIIKHYTSKDRFIFYIEMQNDYLNPVWIRPKDYDVIKLSVNIAYEYVLAKVNTDITTVRYLKNRDKLNKLSKIL